jgi:hypothetical protein
MPTEFTPASPAGPRRCYAIFVEARDAEGFIPQLVTEHVGYQSLAGNGEFQRPWHWGQTYPAAKEICDQANLEDFGVDPGTAALIVLRTCIPA